MEQPDVSIIIPVYNTEEFVEEAVKSIINQTLQNIEIIVVNDGSTDNSGQIVNNIAETDPRVRVINCNNGGQSSARNKGTNAASGKYVYYMDSDDFLKPDALEKCLATCKNTEPDFVFFNGENMKGSAHRIELRYGHKPLKEAVFNGKEILEKLLDTNDFIVSPCLFFIRREYLTRNNLSFYPGIIHEDQLFAFNLFYHADKVAYLNQSLFLRRLRNDSTMTKKFSSKNIAGYLTVANAISGYLKGEKCDCKTKNIVDKYLALTLNAVTYNAHELPFKEKLAYIFTCIKKKYIRYLSVRNIAVLFLKH